MTPGTRSAAPGSDAIGVPPRPAAMRAAYASLLVFTIVYFLQPSAWIPALNAVPLAKVTGALALVAFALGVMGYGGLGFHLPREFIYLIVLFCQLCAAVAFSTIWRGGAFRIVVLEFSKVVLMTVVVVVAVTTWSRFRKLLIVQVLCIGTITLISLRNSQLTEGRLMGSLSNRYGNPNDFALAIDLVVPFVIALLIRTRSILMKALWFLLLGAMSYAVLLTSSRAGLLALLLGLGLCLWEFGVKGGQKALLFLAALGTLALLLAGFTTKMGERLRSISGPGGDESAYLSAQQRKELFWRSVHVTAEHPLFGVGSGNFAQLSGSWHVTHNSYTELSAEGGVLALLLFLLMLWSSFRNLRYARHSASGQQEVLIWTGALRASLAAFVLGACFGSFEYQFLPYFLMAYTTVLCRISGAFGASRPSAGRNFGATSV